MAKLSSKLSPTAKKQMMLGAGSVEAMVEVAPRGDSEGILSAIRAAGAVESHWVQSPRFIGARIPVEALGDVADVDGVVYIDLGKMSV